MIAAVLVLAATGALIFAITRAPKLTLDYIDALRWPVAALILVFFFRRPIASLLDRIERGKVSTPFGPAEFEAGRRPDEPVTSASSTESALEPALEHATTIVVQEADAQQIEEAVIALGNMNSELMGQVELYEILNQIFQMQLNFLSWVRLAPSGVSWPAVQQWYATVQGALDSPWANVHIHGFVNPLLNWGLLEVGPDGNYHLSEKGAALLDFAAQTGYAQKAF